MYLALRHARRSRSPRRGRGAPRGAGGPERPAPRPPRRGDADRAGGDHARSLGRRRTPCSPRPGGRCACRPSAGAARGIACGRWCRPPRAASASLPIPAGGSAAVPLGSMATLHTRSQPAKAELRFRGAPTLALFVYRAHDASPLALDGALRRRLAQLPGGVRGEIGWSEAAPLRALMLAARPGGPARLGARGAGRRAARRPLGRPLPRARRPRRPGRRRQRLPAGGRRPERRHPGGPRGGRRLPPPPGRPPPHPPAGRPGLGVDRGRGRRAGAGGGLPRRRRVGAAALRARPGAAAGGGGGSAGVRDAPPRSPRAAAGRPATFARNHLKSALRDPGTVVLIAATAAYLALTLFGGVLLPRPGNLRPDQGNLTAILRLPQGTPLAETVRRSGQAGGGAGEGGGGRAVLDLRDARHGPGHGRAAARQGARRSGGGSSPPASVRGGRASERWRSPPASAPRPGRAAASSTTSRTIRRPTRRRTATASSCAGPTSPPCAPATTACSRAWGR